VQRSAYSGSSAIMVVGRELGSWGDVRMGVIRQSGSVRSVIPEEPEAAEQRGYGTAQFIEYRLDTLDSLGFPSRGTLVGARFERLPGSNPDAGATARSTVSGLAAISTDNWAGHLYGEYAHAQSGYSPLSLGGFLKLSGTVPDSIQGRSVGFMRLVMARRIGALPVTLGGTVRAGFSIEAGGGFDLDKPSTGNRIKQAGSAFLSVDTRFGPAYVGAGATRDGAATLYLFLGPVW
jgi:NTE family protein